MQSILRPLVNGLSLLTLQTLLVSQADVGLPHDEQRGEQIAALVAYLQAATEEARYSCSFTIDSVSLSRQVSIDPQDSWAFLIPHLKRPATSTPLVAGIATFNEGRFAVAFHNDLYGENCDVAALYDGQKMVEFRNEAYATVWERATNLFIPALPWVLYNAGGNQGAASLRTASMRKEANTSPAETGDARGFDVTFPLPLHPNQKEAMRTFGRMEARWYEQYGRVLPCVFEDRHVKGALLGRMAVLEFGLLAGTPMPTAFQVEVAMNTLERDPPRVVYKGRIDYTQPGPLPQSIVDRLDTIPEIRTEARTIYPKRGIDTAIDRVVEQTRRAQTGKSPVSAQAVPAKATTDEASPWPSVAKHLEQTMAISLTRKQVTAEFCLHAALALRARLEGVPLQFDTLVERHPQGLLSIADGVRILEENGLPSVAADVSRHQITRCKHPVILMEKRSDTIFHAFVVFSGIEKRFAWALGKGLGQLNGQAPEVGGSEVVPVIISCDDWATIR